MTDFEKEIISMYEWLDRRAYTHEDEWVSIPRIQVERFLKDFKVTVEEYKDKENNNEN